MENWRSRNRCGRTTHGRINYKQKTFTYLVPRVLFNLELIDMAQCLHTLGNFLQKQRCRGNTTCFVCHFKFIPSEKKVSYNVRRSTMACISDIEASIMQTLYQYKSALPYMGCCTLLYLPPPENQRMLGEDTGFKRYCAPQSKKRPMRGFILQLMTCVLLLKMKSGRPIIFRIKLIYTR